MSRHAPTVSPSSHQSNVLVVLFILEIALISQATYMIGLLFYLKDSDNFFLHNIQLIIFYLHKLIFFQLLIFL